MTKPHDLWLCPDRLFDGTTLRSGMALRVSDGSVTDLCPLANLGPAKCRRVKATITPGFIDLQVNGGGDALFNTTPTPEGIASIARAHRRFGTIAILPTVITDAPDVLERAAAAAIHAKDLPGMLGLHIEGPHLAPAKRGTHAAGFIRPMDDHTLTIVRTLRRAGIAVMITLAPEAVTSAQIAALAGTGAIVSLGHSDATAEETRLALAAGATCFTHLYNAMSPMLSRNPGMTGACIASTAHAGIICDGIHVVDEMIALAIRARPLPDRMFLVSDAMPTVGGSDQFTLYGQTIRLTQGRLINAEGALAGAHLTMAAALSRLITKVGIDPATALRMATSIPATLIKAAHLTSLESRSTNDVLILDSDWNVQGTLSDLVAP